MADTFLKLTRGVLLIALSAIAMASCEDAPKARDGLVTVEVAEAVFYLEPALDNSKRVPGLGHREHIEPDGGMIFAFPNLAERSFIMRHCPIPIDIAYVSDTGRIVTMYEMQPEPPQADGEGDWAYERRLKQYQSRFPVRFVLEFAGGRLEELGVSQGDQVRFDMDDLKRRAQ